MRRALALIGLLALGVLLGFLVRLVWPRRRGLALDSYGVSTSEPATD
jgi:hypothetical protein